MYRRALPPSFRRLPCALAAGRRDLHGPRPRNRCLRRAFRQAGHPRVGRFGDRLL